MKKLTYLCLLLFMAMTISCNDYIANDIAPTINKRSTKKSLSVNRFKSLADLQNEIKRLKNYRNDYLTRSNDEADTILNLFTPISELAEYIDEDVIEEIYPITQEMMIENGDLTLYEALGYDTLVPDTSFAKLLNIDGMIQVADTVYQITKMGTYFFPDSLTEYVKNNISVFDSIPWIDANPADSILIIHSRIKRYNTFKQDEPEEDSPDVLPDTIFPTIDIPQPLLNQSFASEVDWSKFPVKNADAKTWAGKVWQAIVGRNRSYYYNISSKKRVRTKFFFYNYLVHQSIGAEVELQKKNWFRWSGKEADKLTLNWHNITLEYSYTTQPPYPGSASPFMISTDNATIPTLDTKGVVTSIFGIDIHQDDLVNAISKGSSELYKFLKSKIGKDVPSNSRAYMLYGTHKAIMIIPDGYIDDIKKKEIKVKFYDKWSFGISLNISQITSNWQNFGRAVSLMTFDRPKLLYGEIRAGACYGGVWGGITTVKK